MPATYLVDLNGEDLFEVAALLVSTLAWPSPTDTKQREDLYLSFYSWCVRERAAREPAWAQRRQWIQPNAACRAESAIGRDLRTLTRRLRDRVTAGHIAIAFLKETEQGRTPKLPKGAKRLSINEMVATLDLNIPDIDNITKRVWRPSKPVIHLCAAWASVQQEHWREEGSQLDLTDAMQRPDVLATIFYRAAHYEPLLERGRLAIPADTLIRFRFG